ncbi:hypothetical protein [Clostridium sp.]|uniref:hypothetical protein n=1 Tax=Clostridium sp. TaxID=1506 RepID=UPI0035227D40
MEIMLDLKEMLIFQHKLQEVRKLSVKITANDGTTQTIERTINVERAQSRSYLDDPNNNDYSQDNIKC